MRLLTILILLGFMSTWVKGQPQLNPTTPQELERTKRLAALCKLWGHVTYFHPYLPSRTQAWDSAFAATIPLVKTGQARADYQQLVGQLLAVLQDPATRLVNNPPQPLPSSQKQPTQTLTADSVLIVRLQHYTDLRDWQHLQTKVQTIGQQLTQVKAVLFDLRAQSSQPDDRFYVHYFFEQLSGLFSTTPVISLLQRGRMHDGLVTETGYSTGGFSSATYSLNPAVFSSAQGLERDLPAVFLVNQHSIVPPIALALQQAGKAAVVALGSFADTPLIQTMTFELPDSIQVQMRLTELVSSDGGHFPESGLYLAGFDRRCRGFRVRHERAQKARLPFASHLRCRTPTPGPAHARLSHRSVSPVGVSHPSGRQDLDRHSLFFCL